MRALVAICSFFIMAMVGCGGTEQVGFVGADGKPVGTVDMDVRHVDQMRRGELDMTQHALIGGAGYVVGCGGYPQPYAGEATFHRQQWWAGDCVAVAAYWDQGKQFWFSLNESVTRWPSDGWFINNSIRSVAVKAPASPTRTQFHFMRESDSTGGGYDGLTSPGGTLAWATLATHAECPTGQCAKPPEESSFFGMSYVP